MECVFQKLFFIVMEYLSRKAKLFFAVIKLLLEAIFYYYGMPIPEAFFHCYGTPISEGKTIFYCYGIPIPKDKVIFLLLWNNYSRNYFLLL